jgi:hypothetical protein
VERDGPLGPSVANEILCAPLGASTNGKIASGGLCQGYRRARAPATTILTNASSSFSVNDAVSGKPDTSRASSATVGSKAPVAAFL